MKRALFTYLICAPAAALLLTLSSCSPQAFTMNIEMRHPSKSGLDLSRKSMSIVYLDNGVKLDSAFNNAMSDGFAQKVGIRLFRWKESYRCLPDQKGDWRKICFQGHSLVNLVMDSGDDVVFLIDTPDFGQAHFQRHETKQFYQYFC
jgi:hypothetical protein